jgi:transposase-like protein
MAAGVALQLKSLNVKRKAPAMSLFDNSDIEIPCPHCGKKTKKRIGSVQNSKTFACPSCGKTSTLDASGLGKGLQSAQKQIDDLKRALGKFGK